MFCFEQQKTLCDRDKKMDDSEFRADAQDPGTRIANIILQGRTADKHYHYWVEKLRIGHILARGLRYVSTGENAQGTSGACYFGATSTAHIRQPVRWLGHRQPTRIDPDSG